MSYTCVRSCFKFSTCDVRMLEGARNHPTSQRTWNRPMDTPTAASRARHPSRRRRPRGTAQGPERMALYVYVSGQEAACPCREVLCGHLLQPPLKPRRLQATKQHTSCAMGRDEAGGVQFDASCCKQTHDSNSLLVACAVNSVNAIGHNRDLPGVLHHLPGVSCHHGSAGSDRSDPEVWSVACGMRL